jgi:hypothetical protein
VDEISLKQQAEPVAWLYKKVDAGLFVSDQHPSDVEVWNDIEWSEPLYTAPPQRKPLTEEKIKDCLDAADQMYCERDGDKEVFKARAIEAAHNIKE